MAKKLSRQQRKSHRERSARAEQRGLPATKLEKPSKPPAAPFESARRPSPAADADEGESADASPERAEASALASVIEQVKRLPISVKIASIAALAFALLWAISLFRKSDRSPEAPPALPSAAEQPEPQPTTPTG